jgi:predicted DNA-binding protein
MREAKFAKSISFALSEEAYNRVKKITDEERISMGEWVREAVEATLSNQQQKEGAI